MLSWFVTIEKEDAESEASTGIEGPDGERPPQQMTDSQLKKGQTRIQDEIFILDSKIPADHIERVVKAIQDAHHIAMESFKLMGREFADQKEGNQAVLQGLAGLDLAIKNTDEQTSANFTKALDEIGEDTLPSGLERVLDGLQRQDVLSGTILGQLKMMTGDDKCEKDLFWTTPSGHCR